MAWLIDKIFKTALILFLVWLVITGYNYWWKNKNAEIAPQNSETLSGNQKNLSTLPERVNLDVPFTSQAPEGNWGSPFDHSCEEASVLMIHYYIAKKIFNNPATTASEIKAMNNFEEARYGVYKDTTAEETARFARDYYGYKAKVYYNIGIEDIKKELAKGKPLIVPAAGRKLFNPNFTGLGPLYHMLVIKGYDSLGFITNDPGTRRGANYHYSYDVIKNALHDWNNGDILNGKPAMIVIEK